MTVTHQTCDQAAPADRGSKPLLEVNDLAVSFAGRDEQRATRVRAVTGLSLTIYPRQTLALVGESGCGKSVTALAIMRLLPSPAARIESGSIILGGRDVLTLNDRQMLRVRGRDVAMIFQEPMTSLNPVFTVGDQILEAVTLHRTVRRAQAIEIALQAMSEVGIQRPTARLNSYPHEFSGGMRQRVMIAMALACRPQLLLADEPTTALDVTIGAQILELLRSMQRQRGMAIMLITHDLGIVAQNADVVCVMYAGRIVEYATVFDLFQRPHHPYTRGLLRSRPELRGQARRLTTVSEVVDDPAEFRLLSGAAPGLVPWWPAGRGVRQPATLPDQYALVEVERDHWVGCSSSGQEESRERRPPDVDFRRHP
jgi:ABC-type dipeptide/oligopeptide/nickel transport system ATPase component